jgi:hemerythrin
MNEISYIVWQSEYSVDVALIDNQHKDLLNLVNLALGNCTGNKKNEKEFFDRMINPTIKHLQFHFETEEKIMTQTRYPDYDTHSGEHKKLLEIMTQERNTIQSGKKELDLLWLSCYLRDWLLEHIPTHDKPAAEYFRRGSLL